MIKKLTILLMISMLGLLTACNKDNKSVSSNKTVNETSSKKEEKKTTNEKTLVVYFSATGKPKGLLKR